MEKNTARTLTPARKLMLAAVVVAAGYFVKYKIAATHDPAWIAAGWLLTAWLLVRLALLFRRGYANFRTHTVRGVDVESVDKLATAAMQPWMRGMYQVEKKCHRGFWRTISGKPVAASGQFSVAGGPNNWKITAALLVVVGAATVLCLQLLLPGLAAAPWRWALTLAAIVATALYATSWIVGAYRILLEGGHTVSPEALVLDFGMRGSGTIATGSIASCTVIDAGAGRAGGNIAAGQAWMASPWERANVLIELGATTLLPTVAFGSVRERATQFVAVYADQPALFAAAVMAARAAGGRARQLLIEQI